MSWQEQKPSVNENDEKLARRLKFEMKKKKDKKKGKWDDDEYNEDYEHSSH